MLEIINVPKNVTIISNSNKIIYFRIHTSGNYEYNKFHPDSRAIFYEQKTYAKRRISDFIATLNAFEHISQFHELFSESTSDLLKQLTCINPLGQLPDVQEELEFFKVCR